MRILNSGEQLCLQCGKLPWTASTFAAGLSVKDVAVTDGMELQIVRVAPGGQIPSHTHECPEFIYVLEGELIVGEQRLGPGGASVASVGSSHAGVRSEKGCTFVLVDRPV